MRKIKVQQQISFCLWVSESSCKHNLRPPLTFRTRPIRADVILVTWQKRHQTASFTMLPEGVEVQTNDALMRWRATRPLWLNNSRQDQDQISKQSFELVGCFSAFISKMCMKNTQNKRTRTDLQFTANKHWKRVSGSCEIMMNLNWQTHRTESPPQINMTPEEEMREEQRVFL